MCQGTCYVHLEWGFFPRRHAHLLTSRSRTTAKFRVPIGYSTFLYPDNLSTPPVYSSSKFAPTRQIFSWIVKQCITIWSNAPNMGQGALPHHQHHHPPLQCNNTCSHRSAQNLSLKPSSVSLPCQNSFEKAPNLHLIKYRAWLLGSLNERALFCSVTSKILSGPIHKAAHIFSNRPLFLEFVAQSLRFPLKIKIKTFSLPIPSAQAHHHADLTPWP